MKSTKISNKSGFTIIEVVLVLAIAALIFSMVFLALPALRASQRDTARKNDMGRLMAQLDSYAGNNNGNYPVDLAAFNTFVTNYLTNNGAQFADPTAGSYTPAYNVGTPTAGTGQILYSRSARCGADGILESIAPPQNRRVAVSVDLESGGAYCLATQ